MQRFVCGACATEVTFDAFTCACGAQLGYLPDERTIRILHPLADGVRYAVRGSDLAWSRCRNAAGGCNWVVPAMSVSARCRSCARSGERPDDDRPDAVITRAAQDAAQRLLVHQLDGLGLPLAGPASPSGESTCRLVVLPSQRAVSGHLGGAVPLDPADVDDHRRDIVGSSDGRHRSIIGNLRHQMGHHQWHRLVAQGDHLDLARALFGDERADHSSEPTHHGHDGDRRWDDLQFVTRDATVHPLEDWAETFSVYLHVLDAVETATARGLLDDAWPPRRSASATTLATVLDRWRTIARATAGISEPGWSSLTFVRPVTGPIVADKLDFVHGCVTGHHGRLAFYETDSRSSP